MKNIIVCCDGTGNEFRATNNTNVVKVFRASPRGKFNIENNVVEQISYYDPGVGTFSAPGVQLPIIKKFTKLLGLAFGYGMSKNIEDAYKYLMKTYEEGDKVFLFGFSRGAYTIRALAGMLNMVGLLNDGSENLVQYAQKVYTQRIRYRPEWAKGFLKFVAIIFRIGKKGPDWKRGAKFKKTFSRNCNIHFLGAWDTVKSVGWFRRRIRLPYTYFNPIVNHGRHAVSIHEKRSQYRTNLWGFPNSDDFKEVWFSGVHSDIGGSYTECGLSDITLKWMIDEAVKYGLILDQSRYSLIKPDPNSEIHNPLIPPWYILGWWMLGWYKRKLKKTNKPPNKSRQVLISQSVNLTDIKSFLDNVNYTTVKTL